MILTDTERELIQHALGLGSTHTRFKPARRWAYRNYFAAGGSDVEAWQALVARGFAVTLRPRYPDACPYPGFAVTRSGVEAAGFGSYVPRSLAPEFREGQGDE